MNPQDLETLIEHSVDVRRADYAVVTGIQIHNWSVDPDVDGHPNLEFIQPRTSYVVVDGEKRSLQL